MYLHAMANTPIEALVIQPDATFSAQTIPQDIKLLQSLAGGYVQAIKTAHCVFFCDEDGLSKGLPINPMATYLWWKIQPEMEAIDSFCGPVIVTGREDKDGELTSIPANVLELFHRMESLRLCDEGPAPTAAATQSP